MSKNFPPFTCGMHACGLVWGMVCYFIYTVGAKFWLFELSSKLAIQ
jgi:hypothetical protein